MPSSTTFEQNLDRDPRWALSQGSQFFEGKGAVQEALAKVTRRLGELGIPYCVAGGMALFHHGFRRFTEDIDLIVTSAGLREIHARLDGLGYLPQFTRSKNLRDTDNGVRIEFLIAGEFPGDGKPKPVAFPDPASAGDEVFGIRYLTLPRLIELKLASGMTNAARMKDLADVVELIKLRGLAEEFALQLDPYVQDKFRELWTLSRQRFVKRIRNNRLTDRISSWEQLIAGSPERAQLLRQMRTDGVVIDIEQSAAPGLAYLVCTDPEVARRYDMHEESEVWQDADDDTGDLLDS
jgi:Nucleotidyl transferase AbiEii toxin, Type IV TA system